MKVPLITLCAILVVTVLVPDSFVQAEQTVNCHDFYDLHDCDPQAICVSGSSDSYQSTPNAQCKCPSGFMDKSPNVAQKPGRKCVRMVNECLDPRLNDCDRTASCVDTAESYYCRCPSNTQDTSPDRSRPGRVCSAIAQTNRGDCSTKCSPNADCNLDVVNYSGVTCKCKPGFTDTSPNPSREPGLVCTQPQPIRNDRCDPSNPPKNDCDRNAICYTRGTNDYTCACKTGYRDRSPQPSVFPGRVCELNIAKCTDPSKNDCDKPDRAICTESTADYSGYTCRCRAGFKDASPSPALPGRVCQPIPPRNPCIDGTHDCDKTFAECVYDGNGGFTCKCKAGFVDMDPAKPGRNCSAHQEEPPVTQVPVAVAPNLTKPKCGSAECNASLGEVCINGKCTCPANMSRTDPGAKCVPVISTPLTFIVGSEDGKPLFYSITDYGDPRNPVYVALSDQFRNDTGGAVNTTTYSPRYVSTDVAQISHPRGVNSTWNEGVLVNFTVNTLASGGAVDRCDLWDKLVEAIQKTNGAIGGGKLNIGAHNDQLDPCLSERNECERNATICPLNTRCVDLKNGYRCECLKGFIDASPKGSPSGSVCKPDFCSDVQYCTKNSKCINKDDGYVCQCLPGFEDVSHAPLLNTSHSTDDTTCLPPSAIDACALGLHNCSHVCVRTHPTGFKCQCPVGWVDGDTANPGALCSQALCGLCNQHGTCVTDTVTGNVTCACVEGYTGLHCEFPPSVIPLIILIILAILFLILALCCLLYLCTRCRCFRRRRGLLESTSSDSGIYDQMRIPRAHLYDADSLKSGESEFTIREEVERRVTTDVTRTEMRSSEADGVEGHDVMDTQRAYSVRHEFYPHEYHSHSHHASSSPQPPARS